MRRITARQLSKFFAIEVVLSEWEIYWRELRAQCLPSVDIFLENLIHTLIEKHEPNEVLTRLTTY